jgi:hypothetical protein
LTEESRTTRSSNQKEAGFTIVQAGSEKREAETRYLARVKSYEDKTPPSRADDEAFCREVLGVNRSRARELRKKLAPSAWQKAGPRKKKP